MIKTLEIRSSMDWRAMIIRIVRVITETGSSRYVMASLTIHRYEYSTIFSKPSVIVAGNRIKAGETSQDSSNDRSRVPRDNDPAPRGRNIRLDVRRSKGGVCSPRDRRTTS